MAKLRRRLGGAVAHALAVVLVVLMTVGLVAAERRTSVTVDEYGHLVRGLALFWAPDTRLNWPHPPLAHVVAAAPTVLTADPVDLTKLAGWKESDFTSTVRAYWKAVGYETARAQLVAGRRAMIAMAAAVSLYLWWWAQRRMGKVAGLVALTLWASHTTLLAHAMLVTNDFAAACCALVLATTMSDYLRAPRWRRLLALGVAAGAAVVTKTSLVVTLVACLAAMVAVATAGRAGFSSLPLARRIGRGLRDATIVGLVAWLAVLSIYRFERSFMTVDAYNAEKEPASRYGRAERGPIGALDLPGALPVPLPYTYVFSIQFVREQNRHGHAGWFRGEPNREGQPLYFPWMALYKTPLGLSALWVVGVVALFVRRPRRALAPYVAIGLTVVFLLVASRSRINIGFRHATPIIPWMVLVGAHGAAFLWSGRRLRVARRAVVAVAAGAALAAAVWTWPLYLGDFNLLAGGRRGGLAINLAEEDWGQDVAALARYVKAEKLGSIHVYTTFTTTKQELKSFRVKSEPWKCGRKPRGILVVGIKDFTERTSCFRWLGEREPLTVVNDHLLVFDNREGADAARPGAPSGKARPATSAEPRPDVEEPADVADEPGGDPSEDASEPDD